MHPGTFLFEEIKRNVRDADVVLLLISSNYLSSPACQDEMQTALKRHSEGECLAIPVIVRPCDWTILPLGSILATPKDGMPISTSPHRDVAWLDVVTSLRKLLESWTPPREREADDAATAGEEATTPKRSGGGTHWVYRKSDNDDDWADLKENFAEQLATNLDSKLASGMEDDVRFWGEKLIVDVKHPKYTSTKRLIIDDPTGYIGYIGYQLELYPGAPLGLNVKPRNLRWMQDDAGGSFLATLDGKLMYTVEQLARDVADEIAATPWGKPGKITPSKSNGN